MQTTRLRQIVDNGKARLNNVGFSKEMGVIPSVNEVGESLLLSRVPSIRNERILLLNCNSEFQQIPIWYSFDKLYPMDRVMDSHHRRREIIRLVEEFGFFKGWTARLIGNAALTPEYSTVTVEDEQFLFRNTRKWRHWGVDYGIIEIKPPEGPTIYKINLSFADTKSNFDDHRGGFGVPESAFMTYAMLVKEAMDAQAKHQEIKERNPDREIEITNSFLNDFKIEDDADWKHIVMSDSIQSQVYEDFEFFTNNRAWFDRNGLPYKRGYLLWGPPGNGKTLVTRTMAMNPAYKPYFFDLSDDDNNGTSDLIRAFDKARNEAPSILIFEDFDRFFEPETKRKIPVETLLTCFDGITVNRGVVVVATANHPEWIDTAFMNRPGRFDQVVHVGNPDKDLRYHMLKMLFDRSPDADVRDETLEAIAKESRDFSMVLLKEVFLQSGHQSLLQRRTKIHDEDARKAFELVKKNREQNLDDQAGFGRR